MPSSIEKKLRRQNRLKRNRLAKELADRKWRQRVVKKDYKKKRIKEILDIETSDFVAIRSETTNDTYSD